MGDHAARSPIRIGGELARACRQHPGTTGDHGRGNYYSKPIPVAVCDVYARLVEHGKSVVVKQLSDQTAATHQLLDRFDSYYRPLKHAERKLRFEDVTLRLAAKALLKVQFEEDRDGFFYRLDGKLRHLLLDEFQDTSRLQWQVLAPLAMETASGADDHSFFCVGDAKQSIYGWRGGSPELFGHLESQWPSLDWDSLTNSFRSAPLIIETVNRVFGGIGGNPVFTDENLQVAANEWGTGYAKQSANDAELAGYVCLTTSLANPKKQDDCTIEPRRDRRCLSQDASRSVGVLTRANVCARMIEAPWHRGVAASEGGNPPPTRWPAPCSRR